VNEDPIGKIEDNIQPLFEQENIKDTNSGAKAKTFGKSVSLSGNFVLLKTGESGHIRVERISLESIGCKISRSHHIQINDFLDIRFSLDDIKKSLIKRRGVVREIKGNYIKADFYNPPPFAKNLGFYVLS